jgi:hypothetical protein
MISDPTVAVIIASYVKADTAKTTANDDKFRQRLTKKRNVHRKRTTGPQFPAAVSF